MSSCILEGSLYDKVLVALTPCAYSPETIMLLVIFTEVFTKGMKGCEVTDDRYSAPPPMVMFLDSP